MVVVFGKNGSHYWYYCHVFDVSSSCFENPQVSARIWSAAVRVPYEEAYGVRSTRNAMETPFGLVIWNRSRYFVLQYLALPIGRYSFVRILFGVRSMSRYLLFTSAEH